MDSSLDLPIASINRVVKSVLPANFQVGKEAKTAFSKAAGIWVLYVTAAANEICQTKKRKTISGDDVVKAIEELDFGEFLPALKKFRLENREKRASLAKKSSDDTNLSVKKKESVEADAGGAGAAEESMSANVPSSPVAVAELNMDLDEEEDQEEQEEDEEQCSIIREQSTSGIKPNGAS